MTTAPLPLVVDLDDTLVRTDTLVESAVLLATRAPRKFAAQLPHLFDGRAAFKSALADAAKLDCTTLPYNKDIIAFLEKRMRGRRPFANATDLVYLWVGWSREATVVLPVPPLKPLIVTTCMDHSITLRGSARR